MKPFVAPSRSALLPVLLAALVFAAGCGGDTPADAPPAEADAPEGHGHDHSAKHGGGVVAIGDHLAHLEALHDMEAGDVRAWVADCDGNTVKLDREPVLNLLTDGGSVQVKGEGIGDGWLFAHPDLVGHPEAAKFRLSIGGKTHTVELPHAHGPGDHDHGAHGPHEGTVTPFHGPDGTAVGFVELKLHDDKGDLELWIATDESIEKPFDLPLAATIGVAFEGAATKDGVKLQVRNHEANEDEDGTANNRDGKTNYFIFPGDTGTDASWLMGAEFVAEATVTFEKDGQTYATAPFEMRPHTHGAGGHGHDDAHADDHDEGHE